MVDDTNVPRFFLAQFVNTGNHVSSLAGLLHVIKIFSQDFEAIGVIERGFLLKLEKEAKKLKSTKFEIKVSVSYCKQQS